jgi:hypothetical protein
VSTRARKGGGSSEIDIPTDNQLIQCDRSHDCQSKGRNDISSPIFQSALYSIAVVGFVGNRGGIPRRSHN